MKNQPENELLSAYLDGELTAAEQSQVERLLADNPAARQTLDELRLLRTTLQSLPRQTLGEDLSSRVLQIAADRSRERERPRPQPLGHRLAERIKNNPRLVVWPAIVLTAAILLAVFNPDSQKGNGNRDIAKAGKNTVAQDDDRAVGAKIVEGTEGNPVNDEDQPSISAVNPPKDDTRIVRKGNPDGSEKPITPPANSGIALVVIQCQVSRETLKQEDYRKVFEASGIALPDKSAVELLNTSPAELATAAGIDALTLNGDAKALLVEIEPAKLAGIINGLKAKPEAFREISFKNVQLPAPAASQTPQTGAKTPGMKQVLVVFRAVDP